MLKLSHTKNGIEQKLSAYMLLRIYVFTIYIAVIVRNYEKLN